MADQRQKIIIIALFTVILLTSLPNVAAAYVGPGAGFALISSFFTLFIAFFLAFLSVISWPVRMMYRIILGKNGYKNSKVKKIVIVGLDGLDPGLADEFMKQGKLPNFSKLSKQGSFHPLKTTFPSISPVAWSSFQTGVNPGKHNIFDFLTRDKKTYFPVLSSAFIGGAPKSLKIGSFEIPIGKPNIRLLRKSKPFWKLLSDQGIFSTILRVPITFPPEKHNGLLLSGMCVPDLRGTQGMFTHFTTENNNGENHTGGFEFQVQRKGNVIQGELPGPPDPMKKDHPTLKLPFEVTLGNSNVWLEINNKKFELKKDEYTDWVEVSFKSALGVKISGICRFLLTSVEPDFKLYVTPININPEKAALPVSHPKNYATYLAKYQGVYATLGLAEDTWALNERIIDEPAFLKQCYDIHDEREQMFFNSLGKLDKGLLVCVFDTTDRIQHTFLRFLDPTHPAVQGFNGEYKHVIEDLYVRMDNLIGRVMEKIGEDAVLIVVSDHGFKQFKRGINVNSWLLQNGFLTLKDGADGRGEWLADVDWSKTKAYGLGLAGIYLNMKGRESQGIVSPGEEAKTVKKQIIEKLSGLADPQNGKTGITEVFDTAEVLKGPYTENAMDLIVGYNIDYRASWDSVTGKIEKEVFSDNAKSWGADHCLDPRLVPGVFFCNRKVKEEKPSIVDVAPTVLDLFGVKIPDYLEGVSLLD
ncbi:MAG: nucleotide pyrophosphatase [Calditrichaeota bacterium]|nr:nucleotide pyrophosphatase [Calditrichota bacterium]